ncbi:MAG TPA: diacylglycerol kinase family protein [Microbacteriaceae bacterium]|jgi:diacylglycerol kinase family enzyme|nr:diacylglycerol kinase family protein [Microbacteriaceae bacterium]
MALVRGNAENTAALIYNPTKVDAPVLRALVSRVAEEAGWSTPRYYETTVDDLGDGVTRQALDAGASAVLVAGGDGTVRAVAHSMTGSGVPLGIVPSGTGNLLARNLHLPLDEPETMVRAAFGAHHHPIDVGIADLTRPGGARESHAFVVMAGIGLDAAMIANTKSQLKKSVGWVAYLDGAARSLPSAKPFRVVYQLDDKRLHNAKVQSVLFANCGSLPAGIELIPEASIDDGKLDVAVIQPRGAFGWLAVWRKVWWENSVLRRTEAGRRLLALQPRNSSIRFFVGESFDAAAVPAQPVQIDGDEFGEALRMRCRLEAGGLLVAIPEGHDTSTL